MTAPLGATPQEWGHFDMMLGLGSNMLPVVCDPNATSTPGSKIKTWGKVPSAYTAQGLAHGIKDWQKRDILSNELALWRKDPRLGICVRTGSKSGVYAIDVDINDKEIADAIRNRIYYLGCGTERRRSNTCKYLIPIEIKGSPALDKRIIRTAHGIIEFLADGQQFVAAGCHTSGVRYEWWPFVLPRSFALLDLQEFDSIWNALTVEFSNQSTSTPSPQDPELPNEVLTTISIDDHKKLISALAHLNQHPDASTNDFWSEVGYALLSIKARTTFYQAVAPAYLKQAEEWWEAHQDQTPRSDYRHILKLARDRGWGSRASTEDFPPVLRSTDPLDIENQPVPAKATMRFTAGQLPSHVQEAARILDPEVYVQGNMLVRIGRASEIKDPEGIKREIEQRALIRMTPSFLRVQLGTIADMFKWSKTEKDWVVTDCPKEFAEMFCEQRDWPTLRRLDAIARAPFIRSDGSICDEVGYDAQSRAFHIPSAEFPKLPSSITMDMAQRALETLLDPFSEFPFQTPGSRSAFAAHILTEASRVALSCVPMFWYTAPDAGTGKSLLCDMPATIVHGTTPARRPWVANSEEIRKTLFASLLAGDRSIAFDNVPTGYKARSAELCAFLTSSVYQDRKLGASEAFRVHNRAVVSASGNNITPVSDMARRSLVIRLDANSKDLKQRRFRYALPAHVKEHRVELLMAALTIISGWQQNKEGQQTLVSLPSFEEWSSMVRDPLIWLGMTDPLETQGSETDDESEALYEAFEILGTHFGGREFDASSVRNLAGGFSDTDGSINQTLINAGCQDPTSVLKIGYWLRECRDKLGGGFKLLSMGKGKTGVKWLFKRIDNGDLA